MNKINKINKLLKYFFKHKFNAFDMIMMPLITLLAVKGYIILSLILLFLAPLISTLIEDKIGE